MRIFFQYEQNQKIIVNNLFLTENAPNQLLRSRIWSVEIWFLYSKFLDKVGNEVNGPH